MSSKQKHVESKSSDSTSNAPQRQRSKPQPQSTEKPLLPILQRAEIAPNSLGTADMNQLQRSLGNRAVGRIISSRHRASAHDRKAAADSSWQAVQAKLTLGPVNDPYEREADQVAKQVVSRMMAPATSSQDASTGVQRKPISTLQRQSSPDSGSTAISASVQQSIEQARGGGQSIDGTIRRSMEGAFGTSFAGVRLHTGSQADRLNRSLDARAFTTGRDIFFRNGEYNTNSNAGKELLAHELTHVAQQSGSSVQRQVVQRVAVNTNGGTWSTNSYQPVEDGAEITLEFAPNNNVNAKKIGLIQKSLKVEKGINYDVKTRGDYEAGKFQTAGQKRKAQRSDGESHVDRDMRMNNPIYGAPDLADNQTVGDTPKGKLDMSAKAQRKGTAQNYQLGYRYKSFGGLKQNTRSAKLYDKPNLPGAMRELESDPNKVSQMTFETTALCIDGAQQNSYYGSIEWGWQLRDPDVGVELLPLRKLSDGDPTAKMQQVMANWNQGEFDEGKQNPQIPLPPTG